MDAKEPNAQFIDVTPLMAEKWLNENNNHNRPRYPATINAYTNDMIMDAWGIHNQGIGFDVNGTLIDGQQRLSAIVQANKTIKLLVVTNLPEKQCKANIRTQEMIDGGKVRTVGDRLKLNRGEDNANTKVAIVNMIIGKVIGKTFRSTPNLAYSVIDLYRDEIDFVLCNTRSIPGLRYSPAVAAMVFAARVHLDEVIEFKERYFSGTGLTPGHPALTLREMMISRGSRTGSFAISGGSSSRFSVFNGASNAIESFCKGKMLKKITASPRGYEYFFNRQRGPVQLIQEWAGSR